MNIAKMMAQAKKMQSDMTKKMNEHNAKEFEFSFHNDLVKIKMMGTLEIKEIIINEALVDKDDIDTLQDVVADSINSAISKILSEKEELTKGLVPPGMGF